MHFCQRAFGGGTLHPMNIFGDLGQAYVFCTVSPPCDLESPGTLCPDEDLGGDFSSGPHTGLCSPYRLPPVGGSAGRTEYQRDQGLQHGDLLQPWPMRPA